MATDQVDSKELIARARSMVTWLRAEGDPFGDTLAALCDALEHAEKERDEAREALRPFAEAAKSAIEYRSSVGSAVHDMRVRRVATRRFE